jgi:hypothetical protein
LFLTDYKICIMSKILLSLVALCAFAGLSASGVTTQLSNDFDGNDGNDTGGAFQIVSNSGVVTSDTTNPATGLISFAEVSGNAAVGFTSSAALDLSSESSFTATWVVASASPSDPNPDFNGWFIGVQAVAGAAGDGATLWNNNTAFGVCIRGSNFGDGLDVVTADTVNGVQSVYSTDVADKPTGGSLTSGFTVSMTLNSDDTWTVVTSGLSTDINESGSVVSGLYSTLAGSLFASTSYQTGSPTVQSVQYDSVVITSVPEPETLALLGGLWALAFVALRRRNS